MWYEWQRRISKHAMPHPLLVPQALARNGSLLMLKATSISFAAFQAIVRLVKMWKSSFIQRLLQPPRPHLHRQFWLQRRWALIAPQIQPLVMDQFCISQAFACHWCYSYFQCFSSLVATRQSKMNYLDLEECLAEIGGNQWNRSHCLFP